VETLTALAFNCTLKASPHPSSCGRLLSLFVDEFAEHDVNCEIVRVADFQVKPGVSSDEGDGDEWPMLRQKLLAAEILVMGTPIWLGHPSSICQRVLERLDALLSEEDDRGRMIAYDRVALCAVVGNEDGAHHVNAEVYQGLADVGFTIPASGSAYWIGEAYGSVDFNDLDEVPEQTASAIATAVRQAVHLARILKSSPYPAE
jgi:multimeric flavodoxin WrbA